MENQKMADPLAALMAALSAPIATWKAESTAPAWVELADDMNLGVDGAESVIPAVPMPAMAERVAPKQEILSQGQMHPEGSGGKASMIQTPARYHEGRCLLLGRKPPQGRGGKGLMIQNPVGRGLLAANIWTPTPFLRDDVSASSSASCSDDDDDEEEEEEEDEENDDDDEEEDEGEEEQEEEEPEQHEEEPEQQEEDAVAAVGDLEANQALDRSESNSKKRPAPDPAPAPPAPAAVEAAAPPQVPAAVKAAADAPPRGASVPTLAQALEVWERAAEELKRRAVREQQRAEQTAMMHYEQGEQLEQFVQVAHRQQGLVPASLHVQMAALPQQ